MTNNELNRKDGQLERIAQDDREAFTLLYRELYPKLYRYLLVVTRSESLSQEVLQEVFVKLWIRRQTLAGISSLEMYVLTMVRHQLTDLERKAGRTANYTDASLIDVPSYTDVHEDLILKEYHRIARQAIDALPQRRRAIFLLNAQEGLTAKEIAEKLQTSLAVVKKQLYQANHFIRDFLKDHGELLLIIFCSFVNFF